MIARDPLSDKILLYAADLSTDALPLLALFIRSLIIYALRPNTPFDDDFPLKNDKILHLCIGLIMLIIMLLLSCIVNLLMASHGLVL